MTSPRPYLSYTFDTLCVLFEKSGKDPEILKNLDSELGHRAAAAANALRKRVRAQLAAIKARGELVVCEGCGIQLEVSLVGGFQEFSCPDCGIDFVVSTKTTGGIDKCRFKHGGETICIDFGTSSIRAALRRSKKPAEVLLLGEIVQSSIDDESIPSAILISRNADHIVYGEEALARGLSGERSALFETSPKRWMTEGDYESFCKDDLDGIAVTQLQLVTGLVAYAIRAVSKATSIPVARLRSTDVRISHPVWESWHSAAMSSALSEILRRAIDCAASNEIETVPDSLRRAFASPLGYMRREAVDAVEPVAAALELFSNEDNSREACVVIDIGAGTIDLAAFLSVTPDEDTSYRRKLSRIADPRSLPLAGDAIDAELVALIQERLGRGASTEMRGDIERRKRLIKEELFVRGLVRESGTEIYLQELMSRSAMKKLADLLRREFLELIRDSSDHLIAFAETPLHPVRELVVVFAGGGSGIEFLRESIPKHVQLRPRLVLPIKMRELEDALIGHRHASVERLAVAKGGTTPLSDWPQMSVIAHSHS